MKLFSCQQARELDGLAASRCHIPSYVLMEHAGMEVALAVLELLKDVKGKKIAVVCGTGNNGGDGLAAARFLGDWGGEVSVFILGNPSALKGDAKLQHDILKALNPSAFIEIHQLISKLAHADCIVDAIIGTGLKRPIEGQVGAVVQTINESKKPVVSVDLPSGLDGDSGKILGLAVQATVTVTLAVLKTGLFLYPGNSHAGMIKLAYISIPSKLIRESSCEAHMLTPQEASILVPHFAPDIHKGNRGRVMVIGGSPGYSGAPALSAMAALHAGSGLVYLAIPEGLRPLMETKLTEIIKIGIHQNSNLVFGKESFPETSAWFPKLDALAIGPGIGRTPDTYAYVRSVVHEYQGPLVVDADALFALDEPFLAKHGRPSIILTPHEGEMANLCNLTSEQIHANRWVLVKEKQKKWNVTLVLKGAPTLIGSNNDKFINPTGNPGMATAGSGDVLTGIILSLLGQGLDPQKASILGAYLHGSTGDILSKEKGVRGITAEELSSNLYRACKELQI